MKKLFLTSVAALFLATGIAHADDNGRFAGKMVADSRKCARCCGVRDGKKYDLCVKKWCGVKILECE